MTTLTPCSICKEPKEEHDRAISPRTGKAVKICLLCWEKHYAEQCKGREYHKNKSAEANKKERSKRVDRNRGYIASILKGAQCTDCGYSNWIALEFDHRDPGIKCQAVTKMVGDGTSLATIKLEIAKCDIVCSNCHAIRTAKRGGTWRMNY